MGTRTAFARARARARRFRDGLAYSRLQRRLAGRRLVTAFAEAYPDAFFIEIGANDGEQDDHLHAHILASRWRGLMVEPVPYVFERLRRNYAGVDRVTLENAAIADRDGALPFFYLAEAPEGEVVPNWYTEIGSFSRDLVLGHGHLIGNIEDRLVETSVPCLTFESLCRKHGVEQLDLMLIDTEGYDAQILRSVDLAARHPRLLVYEHYHLSPEQRFDCERLVAAAGYRTLAEGFNTWCLDTDAAPELAPLWRGLQPAVPPVTAAEDHGRGA